MKKFPFVSAANLFKSLFLIFVIAAVSFGCSSDSSSANNEPACGMSFTLNGANYCGTTTFRNVTDKMIEIKGLSQSGSIDFQIDDYTGVGNYKSLMGISYTTGTGIYFSTSHDIVVTKDDGKIIEGTFSFIAKTLVGLGSPITVSDGKFYVKK